ncbi:hypothetical protein OHS59_16265 [Streptomyces sp. NBC_00414]
MDVGTWVLVATGALVGVGVVASHASDTAVKVISSVAKVRDAYRAFRGR